MREGTKFNKENHKHLNLIVPIEQTERDFERSTLGKHRFEQHGSTAMQIFFNKYTGNFGGI